MARLKVNGGDVWHANHQGTGTGMDADTVDGMEAAALLPSDRNLKRDIKDIHSHIDSKIISDLIKDYRYKTNDGQKFGVIAQDLLFHEDLAKLVYSVNGALHIDAVSTLFFLISSLSKDLADTKAELDSIKTQMPGYKNA